MTISIVIRESDYNGTFDREVVHAFSTQSAALTWIDEHRKRPDVPGWYRFRVEQHDLD